jgi:hypothetical protein
MLASLSCLAVLLLVLSSSLVEASSISTPKAINKSDGLLRDESKKKLRQLITRFPPKATGGRIRQRALQQIDDQGPISWLDEWLDELFQHENGTDVDVDAVEAVLVEETTLPSLPCLPCICECSFNLITEMAAARNDTHNDDTAIASTELSPINTTSTAVNELPEFAAPGASSSASRDRVEYILLLALLAVLNNS